MKYDFRQMDLPHDIKHMDLHALELMAVAIREFLIDQVAETGGHLASNLGIVELTLALHKSFDLPRDKVIWDVGHQSYVHKILTGRAGSFDTLRQLDGLSGFPKRRESAYDFYDTGHSSTSIGAACGMAAARDLRGEHYEIVPVIGDGSLTGGPAFEALNNLGTSHRRVIVILNDNGMSIERNIGGLSEHLGKLRTSTGYQKAKAGIRNAVNRVPIVGGTLTDAISNTKERLKYAVLSGGVIFEEFGFTYLGPVDGHDLKSLLAVLENAKKVQGPTIVHVITRKGKGYHPAETFPDRFHGIGPFDKESGNPRSVQTQTYSNAFGEAALALAQLDPNLIAVTAAMTDATGLTPFAERFPRRLFDVGIAEAHAVIFAAGAAVSGLRPLVAIYSSFLQRAYDEVLEDVCLQELPVIFAIDRAGIVGADGETHHGIFDLSYLLPMPGMEILAPCDAVQLKEMLAYAHQHAQGPCAIRYPRGKAIPSSLTGQPFTGENQRLRHGKDLDILAVGTMLEPALAAAAILEEKGISVGVVNVGRVKPFDVRIIAPDTGLIVTLEDNVLAGGFGESLRQQLALDPSYSGTDLFCLGWPDRFIEQGSCEELYARYGLDPAGIARQIADRLLKEKR